MYEPPSFPPPEAVTVVIAAPEDDATIVRMLRDADNLNVVGMAHDAAMLENVLTHVRPQVVFLYHRLSGMWGDTFARTVSAMAGGAPVALLADATERTEPDLLAPQKGAFKPSLYAEALRAGAETVAPWPPQPGELGPIARDLARRHRPDVQSIQIPKRATVIGLRCDAGKTGVSEMAINIACLLVHHPARSEGLRVLLADFDLARGDLHRLLRLSPAPTAGLDALWTAVTGRIGGPDGVRYITEHAPIASYVTPYPRPHDRDWDGAGRVDVLTAMQNRTNAFDFAGEFDAPNAMPGASTLASHPAVTLLKAWQPLYDVIVLDLGADQSPAQLALASVCDSLLVVTTPQYADVQADALGHTRLLRATGLATLRCHVVLNMWDDLASQYGMAEAVRVFREPITFVGAVDYDRALVRPVRWTGYPVPALVKGAVGLPRPFGTQIEEMVKRVLPGLLAPRKETPAGRAAAWFEQLRSAVTRRLSNTESAATGPTVAEGTPES